MRRIETPGGVKGENGGQEARRSGPSSRLLPWLGRRMGASLILAAGILLPAPLVAQNARAQVEEGNRLYEEGQFEEAHEKYLEALLADPESPLIRFNDGNALYRNQDYQRAMERFAEALESEDPAIRSSAWYNLGNALYRQQKLQESLEAFKQSLLADPSDADAKHNLERVLQQLQQQQQQQQQSGQNQEDQQQQQNQSQEDRDQQGQGQQSPDRQEQQEGGEDQPPPQNQPQQEPDEDEQSQGQEPQPQEGAEESPGQPQGQPGEMTPEEAQRLLGAIREDPGEVNRRRVPATGKRPRKDW
jgi:Ca-activated chloride channel family protein